MSSKLGRQHTKAPLAATPTHDVNDVVCCVKIDNTTGVYVTSVPYSFRRVVWVLLRSTEPGMCKCCETDIHVQFSSLSEKTRKANYLQMSLQRQQFLLSYLKTLSVGPAGIRTRDLPFSRPTLLPY